MLDHPKSEPDVLLPPWPKRRRVVVALTMIGFILLSSGLIGAGIYQMGVDYGLIAPPLSHDRLVKLLLTDGAFLRTVKFVGSQRQCVNDNVGMTVTYHDPLKPLVTRGVEACLSFVAIHPTGVDSLMTFSKQTESRAELVNELAERFTTVQADILAGTEYEISRLTGLVEGTYATYYVIGIEDGTSWLLTYAPTSPTLDGGVEEIVTGFRVN